MWNQLLCKHDILTLCVLVTVLADAASGSTIQFHASPAQIQYPVTSSLSMRCGLTGDPAVTSVTPTPGSGLVGKRSTGGTDPIQHVYSMTIYRDKVRVATVSHVTAAQVETKEDLVNVKVTGDVTGTDAEKGYLELTWSFPTSTQTGHYKCLVDGLTSRGHSSRLSAVLDVEAADVTFQDLLKEINGLKTRLDAETARNDAEKRRNDAQQQSIDAEKARNDAQQTTITQMQHKLDAFEVELHHVGHMESGTISCGSSTHWKDGSYNDPHYYTSYRVTKSVKHTFKSLYSKPPIVYLNIAGVTANQGTISPGVMLEHVGNNTFTMRCGTQHVTHYIYDLTVNWLSLPA